MVDKPGFDDTTVVVAFPLSSVVISVALIFPNEAVICTFWFFTGIPLSLRTNTLIVLTVVPSALTRRGNAKRSEVLALGAKSSFALVIEESWVLNNTDEANTVKRRKKTKSNPPSFLSIIR